MDVVKEIHDLINDAYNRGANDVIDTLVSVIDRMGNINITKNMLLGMKKTVNEKTMKLLP